MQVKNQICTERSSTDDPEQDDSQKKTSCFSNIKIFLVSECALMLAQGTVGAYLVSCRTSYLGVPSGPTQRPSSQTAREDAGAPAGAVNNRIILIRRSVIASYGNHGTRRFR